MERLIDADKIVNGIALYMAENAYLNDTPLDALKMVSNWITEAPTVDAVPVEKYNELREAFVDYVCSGVNNQAPYCKNRIDGDCLDERGWCTYRHCRGFNPDGERKDGDGNG